MTKSWHVNIKTRKIDKVVVVKRCKCREVVQSWYMELVKYEKHDKVWRRIEIYSILLQVTRIT